MPGLAGLLGLEVAALPHAVGSLAVLVLAALAVPDGRLRRAAAAAWAARYQRHCLRAQQWEGGGAAGEPGGWL